VAPVAGRAREDHVVLGEVSRVPAPVGADRVSVHPAEVALDVRESPLVKPTPYPRPPPSLWWKKACAPLVPPGRGFGGGATGQQRISSVSGPTTLTAAPGQADISR